jgi:hypothetical protein
MNFRPPFLGGRNVHLPHNVTLFYLFYHVKTHLWMTMMESRIVMVLNIILSKNLTTFDSLFFMGIKM